MYNCLLPEFYLTGALRRILTGVSYCEALLKLWITPNLRDFSEVPYCGALLKLWITLNLRDFSEVPYCGALLRLSISIPQDLGKYLVHQAEPLYLARLNTTERSPGIIEGAVEERLTHCHLSRRHGTHTIGLGIVFQGLLLSIRVFCTTGSPLVGYGSSPCTDSLGRREAIIRIYRPWRIARAPLGPSVSPLSNLVTARSQAWVWGRSPAGIASSTLAGGMDVFFLWLLLSGRGLCDGPIIHSGESYRAWRVWAWSRNLIQEV